MHVVPVNISLSFEATFDSSVLNVAMTVLDDSGPSPIIVQGPAAMANVIGNTYRGKFTPTEKKNYLIHKAVYTDGTFAVLNPAYAQISETVFADDSAQAAIASMAEADATVEDDSLSIGVDLEADDILTVEET